MSKTRYVEPNGYFSAEMLKAFKNATKGENTSTSTKKTVKRSTKKK